MRRILFCFLLPLFLVACKEKGGTERTVGGIPYAYATLAPDSLPALPAGKSYGEARVAVDATVYKGLMEMLGVGGRCLDFSSQMKPDVERLAAAQPDMFLVSAYEGVDLQRYERLGIPVVECRDFLEPSALGRAEWMRFFGRLWDVGERADSLFGEVERNYRLLSERKEGEEGSPSVFFDLVYGGRWYQPAVASTIGQIVADAGGRLAFPSAQQGGSQALSPEQVLVEAGDADNWIIRYAAKEDMTLRSLAALNPVYSQFKAFKEGRVFGCNTQKVAYYEETPLRPDWLIADLKEIFSSPEPRGLRYFVRLE